MGERLVCNQEVVGSTPIGSTTKPRSGFVERVRGGAGEPVKAGPVTAAGAPSAAAHPRSPVLLFKKGRRPTVSG